MLINLDKLITAIKQEPWAKGVSDDKAFLVTLIKWIEQDVIPGFLDQVIRQVDDMIDINPDLSEPEILGKATRYMVDFLGAHHASVRIYDPQTGKMLSFGSYPSEEEKRETFIPLNGSIAGEVVLTRRPYLVPNILEEKRYHNKGVIYKKGVRSLMAIPLEIPRFFPHERDMVGVIQIYYSEKERDFTSLEVQTANLMAKRLSFVIARKKILSMHRTDEIREAIVRHIFRTLGARGGVKMREVFNSVIPELADMVNLQSCAFFSVTEDLSHVILEAGYPEAGGYHSIGKSFPVSSELAFVLLMNPADYSGESVYEVVTPSYILIVDPQKSDLISKGLKKFAMLHKINSILYIPLRVDGELPYFLTFDALDERQRYKDDEIDTFLFLGRELVRARKMERLDDALHDFKNPAIATAGFARRLKNLLDKKETEKSKKQIRQYASILLDETSRLQELALSIYHMGKEEVVNLTEVLRRRFDINKEVIREQLKQKVRLKEGPFDPDLNVRCYVLHVERIFDNLLNNATKAIPHTGGVLEIRTYADGEWACAEITNTGHMSDEDRVRFLVGEGRGRGFYITQRIIRLLKGKIEISGGEETTTFVVRLPRLS
ncbi:MAG: GAF domain-containing sensor histidine kinase [Deltaproteobacteria bacterium]|nr:GAF domain-containing sensor histidine kinase [Deltaproteobacteria bacterium]MBW1909193.1 GAF domain-containing sensor histidine kinase [Deltaproteobacteria bacterium]MBW2033264.1 GAF domain-containing sensor histidine kinase [Deltaproteobacteria bacterium]MBW2114911.1 GAF domain-containing sensor histidine kinase [Deltaproteobacteria bacterium]MBW2357779.1 GAF domain-containing sensor histidine kinase [Deltaproteobacteria bacterium]